MTDNVVSSPVAGQGMVFAGNSYYRQAMLAIRLEGARGDLTDTDRVAWRLNRLTPYVSSPLLYDTCGGNGSSTVSRRNREWRSAWPAGARLRAGAAA